jgi:hypothetical protein
MRTPHWIGVFLLTLVATGQGFGSEPRCCGEPAQEGFLRRFGPAGGWNPYHDGLHWLPRHCFPCRAAPDDYDRKKLPKVCWPPYPPYYIWGPPASCAPQGKDGRACIPPHGGLTEKNLTRSVP